MKKHYRNTALYLLSAVTLAATGSNAFAVCKVNAVVNPGNQNVNDVTLTGSTYSATTVTLDGTTSKQTSPLANVATYTWVQTGGSPTVTLTGANTGTPTFQAPDVGPGGTALKFKLTVTGNNCSPASDSRETTINIADVDHNQAPTADATVLPSPVNEGDTVTLDGGLSSDPDGDALTYSWTQVSGTPVTLSNANTQVATFVAPTAPYPNGTSLTLKLTVSDGHLTSSKDVIVNVLWVNKPPVASVICPATIDEGAAVTLNGTGSADPDDGIASYLWSQTVGGPIPDLPANLTTPSISFIAPSLTSSNATMSFKLLVTDVGGLSDDENCDVKINDKTPPIITVPTNITKEATSPAGADVLYETSANDAVDGVVSVACVPPAGTFPLGTTQVSCSAEDVAGNSATRGFSVTVEDTTPPVLHLPSDIIAEAAGPTGAIVSYTATATDIVDKSVTPVCTPASGSTFALGTTAVNCTATDDSGNGITGTFNVKVQDTTPPVITYVDRTAANLNGWNNSNVTVNWSCSDSVGVVAPSVSSIISTEGSNQSATGTCTDTSGNTANDTQIGINIDKTAPSLAPSVSPNPVLFNGTASATANATDTLSGVDSASCDTPLTSSVGAKTVNCTATDKAGNTNTASAAYSVIYNTTGLCGGAAGHSILQPINADGSSVFKLGSTVPAKFRVCDANNASIGTAGVVSSFKLVQKTTGTVVSLVNEDVLATNTDTAFRWDATAQQWIFNMSTKGLALNTTYSYAITLNDGSTIAFKFGLK